MNRHFLLLLLLVLPVSAAEPKKAGPEWWSLQPIKRPDLANPIDAIVRRELGKKGLSPAASADRATLIRRATFLLTGLPPTPEEAKAFLEDPSPLAWEKVVDRLLASPRYGEHRARQWLDVARYSESHGFEYDRLRDHAWRYRDYVIRSLNEDKPYAQFVREQIAGDVLEPATPEGLSAVGFLTAGPLDQAGMGSSNPLLKARFREEYLEDVVGTVCQTFLGLTLNCARCHDHKFDPVTAREYYRVKAIFEGIHPGDRPFLTPQESTKIAEQIARHQKQLQELDAAIQKLENLARSRINPEKVVRNLPEPVALWDFATDFRDRIGNLHGTALNGAKIEQGRLILDGKGAFVRTQPLEMELREKTLEAWVVLPNRTQGGGSLFSVESDNGGVFDGIVFGERQPGKWMAGSNGFVRTRDILKATAEKSEPTALIQMVITWAEDGRISVYRNGEPFGESYLPSPAKLQHFPAKTSRILFGLRHTGGGNAFLQGEIEETRLYSRALRAEEIAASFKAGLDRIPPETLKKALTEVERADYNKVIDLRRTLQKNAPSTQPPGQVWSVIARQPEPTKLLRRGDVEKPGEVVTPGTFAVLATTVGELTLAEDAPEAERRRKFADWLVKPENPRTWRVMANRIWQHLFGEGLVRSPSDFGFNGDKPTHPEILDFLADELRTHGSLKKLHRQILLSATWQQASTFSAKAAEIDSENRLLWRFAPRRLEGEIIRDTVLFLGGNLREEMGGPGFRAFKVQNFNSTFYELLESDSPDFRRRSIYRMNVNSARDPLLDVLDCPDPSVKTPKRTTTTTPLQALSLMNSPFIQRESAALAARLAKEAGNDPEAQIERGFALVYGRRPTATEKEKYGSHLREFGGKSFCWVLFNSSEMMYLK